MGPVWAVVAALAAAFVARPTVRMLDVRAGRVLCLVPAALTAYFITLLPEVARGERIRVSLPWLRALGVELGLVVDGLGLLLALLITGVGTAVFLYAGRYLGGHEIGRFYTILFLFLASMLGLVLADNTILLYTFWELTSITSFLLIGFEHREDKARLAALQSLLVTVAGGQALLVGFLLLGQVTGTFGLEALRGTGTSIQAHGLYIPILLLVAAGTFTKSALVPFHFWLPAAMEAPTPVSAYLHAATMVKAGVYLLARLNPMLGGTSLWQMLLTTMGLVTLVASAWMAVGSTDLKRVLAYSTIAVLGVSAALIGMGSIVAAQAMVVYLAGHAAYKGSLFMVAGLLDHQVGERDAERLGGLFRSLPVTATAAVVAALSMIGLPPFLGFVGKELVYEAALEAGGAAGLVVLASVLGFTALVAAAVLAGLRPFAGVRRPQGTSVHEGEWELLAGPLLLAAVGLVFGLHTGWLLPLFGRAAAAIAGPEALDPHLQSWPSLSAAFALSATSVVLGALVFFARRHIRAIGPRLQLTRFGPSRAYDLTLKLLDRSAHWQTRVLQHGSLRRYVLSTVAALAILLGTYLVVEVRDAALPSLDEVHFHELVAVFLLLAGAFTAVVSRTALTTIIALAALGVGEALIYAFFSAPDPAMAQLVVQILTLVIFALVLSRFKVEIAQRGWSPSAAVVAIAGGAALTWLTLVVVNQPEHRRLPEGLAARVLEEAHGRNIVNTILVDFRALDTLGEIAVLAMAGLGIFLLLRRGRGGSR